jgi:hypothetical protein
MSNETFGILYQNWNDDQHTLYLAKKAWADAIIFSATVVYTQYAVSEWIWYGNGKPKRPPHHAPVYLISGIIFLILTSILMTYMLNIYDNLPLGYRIATPIVVLASIPLNLLFCFVWTKRFEEQT